MHTHNVFQLLMNVQAIKNAVNYETRCFVPSPLGSSLGTSNALHVITTHSPKKW